MRTKLLKTKNRIQVEGVTMTNLLVENEQNVEKIEESGGIRNENNCANSIVIFNFLKIYFQMYIFISTK